MSMRSTRDLIWRNLAVHPLRTVLTALAITLGVGMVLAAAIIGEAASRQAAVVAESALPLDLEISRRDGGTFATALLRSPQDDYPIDQLIPSLTVQVTVQPDKVKLQIKGVPPSDYETIYQPDMAGGRFLPEADSIVLPVAFALQHGLSVNDAVTLATDEGQVLVTVSGRLAPAGGLTVTEPEAFVPLDKAQELAGMPGQADHLAVVLTDGADLEAVNSSLKQEVGDEFIVARTAAPGSTNFNLLIVQAGMGVIGLIILFAASFVILNAFAMAVTARTEEIGALRALGMRRRQVLWLVLAEAGMLGVAGSLFGLLVGAGLAFGVLRGQGLLTEAEFVIPWWGLILAPLLGVSLTLGAAIFPAWQASRVPPIVAVRGQVAADGQSRTLARTGRLGLILLLSTLAGATLFALGLQPNIYQATGAFGLVVLLLLVSMVFLLPGLVVSVSQVVRPVLMRFWGANGRLAADNLNRNPVRTAFTSSALTAGLLMIVASTGFLQVFLKGGFSAPVSQIQGDAWISYDVTYDSGGALDFNSLNFDFLFEPLDPVLLAEIERLSREANFELLPIRGVEVPAELQLTPGSPALIVDPVSFFRSGNFSLFEGDEAQALAWLEKGNAILLQPYLAERTGADVGDLITIPTPKGDVEFVVAGIGGSSFPMAILPFRAGELYFDAAEPSMIGLFIQDDQAPAVAQIEELLRSYPRYHLFRVSEMNNLVQNAMEQMQSTLTALLFVAVIVAALGVVNTMVINVAERWREIGLLRAVGATRRQVREVVMAEAATLGFAAAVIAAFFGFLLLGVLALLFLPNGYESMGQPVNDVLWSEAYAPALRDMGIVTLVSLILAPLIAATAAYFPARQAAAVNVVEATRGERLSLRHEQSERPEQLARRRLPRSLSLSLAIRNLDQHRVRTVFSALAVSLGVAMTITTEYVTSALLDTLQSSGQGSMQITHGFIVEQFDMTMGMVSYVLMGAAAFLVYNAFAMSISERQQQIGALRSLGMTRRQVMRLVMLEALLVGGLGTLFGIMIGPLLGQSVVIIMQRYGGEFLALVMGPSPWARFCWPAALLSV
jgi:putative ABC transport system permease protein